MLVATKMPRGAIVLFAEYGNDAVTVCLRFVTPCDPTSALDAQVAGWRLLVLNTSYVDSC